MRSFHILLLRAFFILVAAASLHAQDSVSFVIAPPPVGYPELIAGNTIQTGGANFLYMNMDSAGTSMTLMGAMGFVDFQNCISDNFAIDFTTGASILAGDQYNLLALQAPFGLNLIAGIARTQTLSLFAFGGGACNIGMTSMTMSIWSSPSTYEDLYILTTDITGTVSAGLQASLTAGSLVVSPYVVWSRTGGQYDSTMTSSYYSSSSSGSIEESTALVFGFDILHKPSGTALSSMLRKTDSYQLISLSLKWVIQGPPNEAGDKRGAEQ